MQNEGIIRNRLKIAAVKTNAQAFRRVQGEFGSFSNYLWGFTQGKIVNNKPQNREELPATTPLSDQISRDLQKRGFKFVGSTIVYAYLQAVGVVNDHIVGCFKAEKVPNK